MLDTVTIIISTYHRYSFLLRLIKFYNTYDDQMKLMVLDSTPYEPNNDELIEILAMPNIMWKKYPEDITGVEKIADGLNCVKTEYSVLCADDDFFLAFSIILLRDIM